MPKWYLIQGILLLMKQIMNLNTENQVMLVMYNVKSNCLPTFQNPMDWTL